MHVPPPPTPFPPNIPPSQALTMCINHELLYNGCTYVPGDPPLLRIPLSPKGTGPPRGYPQRDYSIYGSPNRLGVPTLPHFSSSREPRYRLSTRTSRSGPASKRVKKSTNFLRFIYWIFILFIHFWLYWITYTTVISPFQKMRKGHFITAPNKVDMRMKRIVITLLSPSLTPLVNWTDLV